MRDVREPEHDRNEERGIASQDAVVNLPGNNVRNAIRA